MALTAPGASYENATEAEGSKLDRKDVTTRPGCWPKLVLLERIEAMSFCLLLFPLFFSHNRL